MKLLLFVALAFFCGIDGFALFAPYAAFVVTVDLMLKKYRQTQADAVAAALDDTEAHDLIEVSPL